MGRQLQYDLGRFLSLLGVLFAFGANEAYAGSPGTKHRIEPGEGVHQWIASESERYFSSQIVGSEISQFIGTWEVDGIYANTEQLTVIDGARDEDKLDKPPLMQGSGGDMSSLRHFCASGEDIYTGYNGTFDSALTQVENIWSNHEEDNILMQYRAGNKIEAYYRLGHALHLVADMTIPAHTHNDPHGTNMPALHDCYEQCYAATHFTEYRYDDSLDGAPIIADKPIPMPASLHDLFVETAEYTDDYDSNHRDGEYAVKGDAACFFPDYYPSAQLHRPGEARREGTGGSSKVPDAGCAVIARDLFPWAMRATAQMFRLFYRDADQTQFEARVRCVSPFTGLSTDINRPTLHTGSPSVDLDAVFSINWEDKYPPSGVVRDSVQIHYNFRPEGSDTWEGDQTLAAPAGAGPVALTLRAGLYMFSVSAESGAGIQATSIPRYLKVSWLKLTRYPVGGWYSAGTPLNLDVAVENGGAEISYQWFRDGSAIDGATGSRYQISTLKPGDAGMYTCTIFAGDNGATVTPAAEIDVYAAGELPATDGWALLAIAGGILAAYRIRRPSRVR